MAKENTTKETTNTDKKDIGITVKKEDDFSEWYTQLILKSELADYSAVSGCIVFRPRSYQIWEKVQKIIDAEFKKIGIQNTYFPLLIPEKLLSKEEEHVQGFTPEVAWVTKAGDSDLNEKLAVRPTSETIMYDSYSKWIRSWRDLPLRLNQWNNVVRWEFKHPVPFFRTREFLWNEGHHAYSNPKELIEDRDKILKIYFDFMKDYMAVPGMIGRKSDNEKFAGAVATYSIETILPNGKAIQGPDYHDDGQNFAKAYDISFLDEEGNKQYAYQSTYAITTRMLGVMFAMHSDDKGLIVPPKLAENKLVIVPIFIESSKEKISVESKKINELLLEFNPILDSREECTPGWKYSEWELKGIPLRIEFGPKDMEKGHAVVVRRDTAEKQFIKLSELKQKIPEILEKMQQDLYIKAQKSFSESKAKADNFADFLKHIENKKIVFVPYCNTAICEADIKEKSGGAKSLNIPMDDSVKKEEKCFCCKNAAKVHIYFGKSY